MTDTDQIAMFKDYYETQIEAVMAREIEIQEELNATQRRNEMQKNRIEMLDKKVEELRGKLSDKEDELRELLLGQEIREAEFNRAARETDKMQVRLNEMKKLMHDKEVISLTRIKEIQALKDQQRLD